MDHGQKEIHEFIVRGDKQMPKGIDYTQMIRNIFQSPQNLCHIFYSLSAQKYHEKKHGLDLNMIFRFYRSVDYHKNDEVLSITLEKSLQQFLSPQKSKDFTTKTDNIRYFLVVFFWDKLFLVKNYHRILLKYAKVINENQKCKNTLQRWFQDIPKDYLKLIIKETHEILQGIFIKLEPKNIVESQLAQINDNIENICSLLELLYKSNQKNPRVKNQRFAKKNIVEHFRHIDIFKLYLKKIKQMNFTRFPFLLDLDYKYKLLQIQSVCEQKMNIEKNLSNGMQNLFAGLLQENGDIGIDGLVFLHFKINRQNILNDSLEKLCKVKHNLKSPMKIKFIGEQGADEGGVMNQYFQLVIKQIFNPYLDMFLPKNNSRVYWFNGFSYEPPIRFQFVGMLFGLAIYNQVHLDVRFPKILYKRLLFGLADEVSQSTQQLIEDLNEIEPDIHRSLKQILESTEDLDPLELYFNIQLENFGEKTYVELVQDGNQIKLCQDNKDYYCFAYVDYLLNKHIQKQIKAFKKGFDRVCNTDLIKMFSPGELQVIICGKDVVDFTQLQNTAKYQGYTKDSLVVKNLWEVLKELSQEDKKAFLFFCTGSQRVPLDGLKSLNFLIQKNANSESLPTAHTCFNVFLLPDYQTKGQLKKNIDFIIKNNQGFGLI